MRRRPARARSQNVATLSLESPYYGARKPAGQSGSKLQRVSDLLVMGRATIEESLFLLAWAQRQGHSRLGARALPAPSCAACPASRGSVAGELCWQVRCAGPAVSTGSVQGPLKVDSLAMTLLGQGVLALNRRRRCRRLDGTPQPCVHAPTPAARAQACAASAWAACTRA
jgi:hypothetical protein